MATRPKPSAKNETGEYANFERALKKVLSVSHSEIEARLDAAKIARQNGRRASGHASRVKDQKAASPTFPVTSANVNRFPAICDKANWNLSESLNLLPSALLR
jgi:hypothetical protein